MADLGTHATLFTSDFAAAFSGLLGSQLDTLMANGLVIICPTIVQGPDSTRKAKFEWMNLIEVRSLALLKTHCPIKTRMNCCQSSYKYQTESKLARTLRLVHGGLSGV